MGGVRKIDSETGSESGSPPNLKTPDPAPCPSLLCFYIHSVYTISFIPNPYPAPDPVFPKIHQFRKMFPDSLRSGSGSVSISARNEAKSPFLAKVRLLFPITKISKLLRENVSGISSLESSSLVVIVSRKILNLL